MYRGRGKIPSISTENKGYNAPHYTNYKNRTYIIIKYDKTFLAIELITTVIIVLLALAAYLYSYKMPFEDPISIVKKQFLDAQLITIFISIILTVVVTFFTKSSKDRLIRNLRFVAIISCLAFIVFGVIKINMNSKYDENKFSEFYEQSEYKQKDNNKKSNKISIGLSGVKTLNEKEFYIEKSIEAYRNFTVKSILLMTVQLLEAIVVLYLSHRLSVIENKKEKLQKDDKILYDEEENIKF